MKLRELTKTLDPNMRVEIIIKSTGARVTSMEHDTIKDLNDIYMDAEVKKTDITKDGARIWL